MDEGFDPALKKFLDRMETVSERQKNAWQKHARDGERPFVKGLLKLVMVLSPLFVVVGVVLFFTNSVDAPEEVRRHMVGRGMIVNGILLGLVYHFANHAYTLLRAIKHHMDEEHADGGA